MNTATNTPQSENHLENSDMVYEGLQVRSLPAPFSKRFLALCVDYGVLTLFTYGYVLGGLFLFAVLFGGGALAFKSVGATGSGAGMLGVIFSYLFIAVMILGLFAVTHGYFIYFEFKKGRTPGKKIFGLTIVTDDGQELTFKKCMVREIFRYIDLLVIPGIICWAVTKRRQRIGDVMAGTFVAYSKQQEEGYSSLYMKSEDYNYIFEVAQPSPTLEIGLMKEYLLFANSYFLSTENQEKAKISHLAPKWESQVREYYKGPQQSRMDQTTALLFFAEYCYRLLKIEEEKLKKGS